MSWTNAFWFAAGLLCALGLVLVARPAWRAAARPRLSRSVVAVTVVAAVCVAAVIGMYLWLGRPELIDGGAASPAMPGANGGGMAAARGGGAPAQSMDAAIAGLEARLARSGGSDADWQLLAQSYEFVGRMADAAAAREKRLPPTRSGTATAVSGADGPAPVAAQPAAVAQRPLDAAALKLVEQANAARRARRYAAARDVYVKLAARSQMNADTWADYADVSASLNGGKLAGEPEKFIDLALSLDPQHPKALWLQASALHETGRYAAAVAAWQHLAAVLDPKSADAGLIAANLAEDRQLAAAASGANTAPASMRVPAASASPGRASVSGEVTLADALRSRAAPGLTLYIVAKSVDQPGMPVAVLRTTTAQWPLRFTLDDSLAMMPGRALSSAGRVTVEARISRSGLATPTAGDLQGSSGVIDPKAGRPLRIVIDRVVG